MYSGNLVDSVNTRSQTKIPIAMFSSHAFMSYLEAVNFTKDVFLSRAFWRDRFSVVQTEGK